MELFSLTDIKKKNLVDVYHYIYHNHGCSKQVIATALNMSLPTITQHLTTLLNAGLIEKCGRNNSSVGRKATLYCTIATAKIAIGIEILVNKVYIVAINLYGKKEAKEKFNLHFHPNQQYFDELKNLVMNFLKTHGFHECQLLGIGLGIQGLASADGTEITYGEILKNKGLTIDMFSRYFSVPCRFIHGAECAANSELWGNSEIKNAIYLSLGHHLGGAIIIDGILQTGLTGKSGTFEHMTLIPNGLTCYCGQKGCAECYCSGNSLLDKEMDLEDFFAKKEGNDAECIKKWRGFLKYLAMLIHNLHTVIECTIILGGKITPYFTDEDILYVRQLVLELSTFKDETSYIVAGRCRNDAVSIGAALPFVKEFLNGISLHELFTEDN